MKPAIGFLLFIAIVSILAGCNASKPYYNKSNQQWKVHTRNDSVNAGHRIFFTGDARLDGEKQYPEVFSSLYPLLQRDGRGSSLVLLGNMFSTVRQTSTGKVSSSSPRYDRIFKQLNQYEGNLIFLPGHLDWDRGRKNALKSLEERKMFLKQQIPGRSEMETELQCPGPWSIELSSNTLLILVNSQWWLQDWRKLPGLNERCNVTTRAEFLEELDELLSKNRDKNIVIAMHHSIYSSGKRGGKFSYLDHLFPLRNANKHLWIPLPFIGSLYPAFKKMNGSIQDHSHPRYKSFRKAMLEVTEPYDRIVFVSAHDLNLQYREVDGQHHIVSGASNETDYVRRGQKSAFLYSGLGFASLLEDEEGALWLEMWAAGPDAQGKLLFQKPLLDRPESAEEFAARVIGAYPELPRSKITAASTRYKAGKFKSKMLGAHYRTAWATEIKVRSIDLEDEKGGLIPVKKGGGFATKSLRMINPKGHQYVLRSVDKNPLRSVPEFMRRTFIAKVVQDQISASHPYGALVIPKLAAAAGIYYARPELVYLYPQAGLGIYLNDFKDRMYLMEERPDDNMYGFDNFGNSTEVVSYRKAIKNTMRTSYNRIDQQFVLKSRLFDMWIGDWDRHDDQWRWATFQKGNYTQYRPIPRDRDQAFYKFDGALPWLLSRKWIVSKSRFQSFEDKTHNIVGLNFNARYFDRAFLTGMDWEDWISVIDELRDSISDLEIEKAVATWPQEIYDIDGEDIISKLKVRRNDLKQIVRSYYEVLSRQVSVVGTDDSEYFDVRRLKDGSVSVLVQRLNWAGERQDTLFDRIFLIGETGEIRLYGLDGEDHFVVKGASQRGIVVRIIGGAGMDQIEDASNVSGPSRKTKVYDHLYGAKVNLSRESKNNVSSREDVNEYVRDDFKYDVGLPLLYLGYNGDDGIFLGLGVTYIHQGFRKRPYHSKHSVAGNFAFKTNGFNIKYVSEFKEAVGKFDIHLDFRYFGINYVRKYFGLGNETINIDPDDRDFNRVRMRQGNMRTSFQRRYRQIHNLKFGPSYQVSNVDQTPDRFVSDERSELAEEDFKTKHYLGVFAEYEVSKVDSRIYPTRGIKFINEISWSADVKSLTRNYVHAYSDLIIYYGFDIPLQPVIAARLGVATNIGDFEFFQSNTLGGRTNLRGYSTDRFSGTTSLFQNTELRLKLAEVRNVILPFSFGVFGLADFGRVWQPDEISSKWHRGFGGGVWISPLGLLTISGSYSVSEEDKWFNMHFRFQF